MRNKTSLDPIKALPQDLALTTLSYLNKSDLATCSALNPEWNVAVNDPELWKEMAKQIFKCSINAPCPKDFIKKYTYQKVNTNDQIVDRIEKFLKKIQLGQKAKLTCFLGQGDNYQTISVEILSITPDQKYLPWKEVHNHEFDFEESYYSSNKLIHGEISTSLPFDHHFPYIYSHDSSLIRGQRVTYICTDAYKACMRLPELVLSSHLEIKIRNLMEMKLNQLETDQQRAKTVVGAISNLISNFVQYLKRKDPS